MRRQLIQLLSVAIVLACICFLARNVAENIGRQGIATGFDFFGRTAGFAIIQTLIPYSESSSYGRAFVVGLLNTALVAVLAIVLSTILGFILGVARLSNNWLIAKLAASYVELIRNVPLLLQIFFWYFVALRALPVPRESYSYFASIFLNNRGIYLPAISVAPNGHLTIAALGFSCALFMIARKLRATRPKLLQSCQILSAVLIAIAAASIASNGQPFIVHAPELQGFNFTGGIVVLPELAALLMGLSIYTAAFIAEIVRAGILGVGRGQKEAAYSLGMTAGMTMRFVILPQAIRIIRPPLTSQFLNVVKNSSLAAAIGYPDLVAVFAGTVLNQTGQAVEVIFVTMMVYLGISLGISLIMNWHHRQAPWAER